MWQWEQRWRDASRSQGTLSCQQQPPETRRDIGKGFSLKDSPDGAVVRNPPANAGDMELVLVQEDPTYQGATKPVCYKYWGPWTETTVSLPALEPVLCNKKSHCIEKPTRCSKSSPCMHTATGESLRVAVMTVWPRKNKYTKFKNNHKKSSPSEPESKQEPTLLIP